MALTKIEQENIDLKATQIAFAVCEKVCEKVLTAHVEACPYGKALYASKWFVLGVVGACSLVGGGGIVALLKVLPGM